MHAYLRYTIGRFDAKYAEDPRVSAMYLYGSGGDDSDDEFSDVDLAMVIKDEFYHEVLMVLRNVCESICGKIHLWFPEGESAQHCNYAFLFENDGRQFLYDFTVMTERNCEKNPWPCSRKRKILFDKTGVLGTTGIVHSNPPFDTEKLKYEIHHYWIYAYLNGKYFRRADQYKLLYIQNVLFNSHMKILNALYPEDEWIWWPADLKKLPAAKQKEMLLYFGSRDIKQIIKALQKEIGIFSIDAENACVQWRIVYPDELEKYVRRHLQDMIRPQMNIPSGHTG